MIGYLKGKILYTTEEGVLLEVGGVGYEVTCSGSAMEKMNGMKEAELFTYMQVREDGISLFGFSNKQEKEMFLKLISVSGVGPKGGIAILSTMNINTLSVAIATSDTKTLCKAKGLGKKTAERIILELKDKMAVGSFEVPLGGKEEVTMVMPTSSDDEDAIVALMNLGFSRPESMKAISQAKSQGATKLEDIIMLALRGM